VAKWTGQHQININGKRDHFEQDDFLRLAKHYDIPAPVKIIREVCHAAKTFNDFAQATGLDEKVANTMKSKVNLLDNGDKYANFMNELAAEKKNRL